MKRERNLITIALGDGRAGEDLKRGIEHAASRATLTVSTWARQVLADAVRRFETGQITTPLEDRVGRLEDRVALLEVGRDD